ncbi:hypothetical protein MIMGU_mgv1a012310mg [Erythranthe guttata]|uniref:DUF4408 domain-containing protein n=1 Tax=Erythranthe guttata TaxID=4155 RepID=A0A022QZ94_ERYGU|nr:PREDICTED: uncharacterized protein LOC105963008 [Erythranthe guttata]EYU32909.1 hypothetical protein MIMGU_mgv1a012310mg [Erythranthe guttata]|eukprot:XP_012842815.1 PREDICTED: uncharacterized protein LOC105963008 [Erythranthe guttata]
MESEMIDVVRFEKENALASFNRFRGIAKFRQVLEVVVVLGLISWSTPRVPAALTAAAASAVEFSAYLLNHHVVFLIGNAIIVLLFALCRQNDAAVNSSGDGDFYDDYLKHSEAVHHREPNPAEAPRDEEKQIVVLCKEETVAAASAAPPQCDDVAAAIDMATRQIKRFQRTQSERLRRDIAVRPQQELRRSETQNFRKSESSGEGVEAADMESLSSEEFRQTVDAFIDKHWVRKKTKQHQFEEHEKYHLMKMAY